MRAGLRVDRGDRVADVVGRVERLHVVGRDDVLHLAARRELVDHLEGGRVDHPDLARAAVRHVDQRLRGRPAAGLSMPGAGRRRRRWPGRSPAACRAARSTAGVVGAALVGGGRDVDAAAGGGRGSDSSVGRAERAAGEQGERQRDGREPPARAACHRPGPLVRPPNQRHPPDAHAGWRARENVCHGRPRPPADGGRPARGLAARTTARRLADRRPAGHPSRGDRAPRRDGTVPSTWPRPAPAPRPGSAPSPPPSAHRWPTGSAGRPTRRRSSRPPRPWPGCCSSGCP